MEDKYKDFQPWKEFVLEYIDDELFADLCELMREKKRKNEEEK